MESTRRTVEFVDPVTRIGNDEYAAGDVQSFPYDQATRYINAGIAKDLNTGEIGERKVSKFSIEPDGLSHKFS